MLRTKKKLEQDCTDLNLNWYGNFESEIKCVLDKASVNSRKDTFPSWTDEIFTIASRRPSDPPVYRVEDYNGEIIGGNFYAFELQRVIKEDNVYKIDKILKTRKRLKEKPNTWYIGKDIPRHSTAGKLTSLNLVMETAVSLGDHSPRLPNFNHPTPN